MENISAKPEFPWLTAVLTLILLGLFAGLSYWLVQHSEYRTPVLKQEQTSP